MRYVIVTDSKGRKRRFQIRDHDSDESAARTGIPAGPPDMESGIEWEGLIRQTTNFFTDNNIFTWSDLANHPQIIVGALNIYKRYLIDLFRQDERVTMKVKRTIEKGENIRK